LTVKLAVVGSGGIAQLVHIPAALRTEGAELVAVCDIDEVVASKVAEKFGIREHYTDAQKMYDNVDIDAVLNLTYHTQHSEATIQAAKNGKHVMVEKPMGMTVAECEDMISTCKKSGVWLMLAFMKRFDPSLQWVKENIENGKLGKIFVVNSWYCDTLHHMDYVGGFISGFIKSDMPRIPMQVDFHKEMLLGHGVHHMDLLHWIGGPVENVTTRYTELDRRSFVSNSIVEYENGSAGTFQLAGVISRDWTEGLQVHGSGGSAEVDINFPYFKKPSPVSIYFKESGAYAKKAIPYRDQYLGEIQHFVDSIADNRQPLPSGEDGLYAQRMVEAAYGSALEKSTVSP
jgi:predicted dehydrogenase